MCNTGFEKALKGIQVDEVDKLDIVKKLNEGTFRAVFSGNKNTGGTLTITNPKDKNFKLTFKIIKEPDGGVKVQGVGVFAKAANGGQYMLQQFVVKEIKYQSLARAVSEMKHLLGNHTNFGDLEGSIFAVHGDNYKGPNLK